MRRTHRPAFTLIELLVVVAIIALLMAILLPSLRAARQQARQAVCGTNQRSVAQAILIYAQENNDYWHAVWDNNALRFRPLIQGRNYLLRPFVYNAAGNVEATDAYWAVLYDRILGIEWQDSWFEPKPNKGIGPRTYIKGWDITRCPEAQYTLPAFRNGGTLAHDPYTKYSTYSFNGVTPGYDGIEPEAEKAFFERGRDGQRTPRQLARIRVPARIFFFHDGSEVMMDGNGDLLIQMDQWNNLPGEEATQWQREYFRHPGGSVAAYADGHVDTVSRKSADAAKALLIANYGTARGISLPGYNAPY